MPQARCLLSMLLVAVVLAIGLARPLAAHADDGTPGAPPAPDQADTRPIVPRLPLVTAKRAPATRRTQLHLPFGRRVVDYARHLLGIPYAWGGASPHTGFDCSGFVRYVYAHFGVTLAHSSYAQFARGRRIVRAALKPGDLVFFDHVGHVGIYLGRGRFIHAPHTGTRVRIETLAGWYGSRFDGARRLGFVGASAGIRSRGLRHARRSLK